MKTKSIKLLLKSIAIEIEDKDITCHNCINILIEVCKLFLHILKMIIVKKCTQRFIKKCIVIAHFLTGYSILSNADYTFNVEHKNPSVWCYVVSIWCISIAILFMLDLILYKNGRRIK